MEKLFISELKRSLFGGKPDHQSVAEDGQGIFLAGPAQRIEHYEIAAYGAARHFAHVLGLDSDAELLNQTIHEEGHADHLLTSIADRMNPIARKAAA